MHVYARVRACMRMARISEAYCLLGSNSRFLSRRSSHGSSLVFSTNNVARSGWICPCRHAKHTEVGEDGGVSKPERQLRGRGVGTARLHSSPAVTMQ
jgi:hypothetical protein